MFTAFLEISGAFVRYLLFKFVGLLFEQKKKRDFDSFLKEEPNNHIATTNNDFWNAIVGFLLFALLVLIGYLVFG